MIVNDCKQIKGKIVFFDVLEPPTIFFKFMMKNYSKKKILSSPGNLYLAHAHKHLL